MGVRHVTPSCPRDVTVPGVRPGESARERVVASREAGTQLSQRGPSVSGKVTRDSPWRIPADPVRTATLAAPHLHFAPLLFWPSKR